MTRKFSFKSMLAGAVALSAGVAPTLAGAASPEGIWWPENQESKYEFSFCRGDNERLCAKLVWITEAEQNEKNMIYMNTYIFNNLAPKDTNEWNGGVTFKGISGNGTVTMQSEDLLQLKVCAFFLCETLDLSRAPAL